MKITITNVRSVMDWSKIKKETHFDFHVVIEHENGKTEYAGSAKENEEIKLDEE